MFMEMFMPAAPPKIRVPVHRSNNYSVFDASTEPGPKLAIDIVEFCLISLDAARRCAVYQRPS
jgi:hypothetical protein